MIKGGKGGNSTTTGLRFEKKVNLKTIFNKLNGYKVLGDILYYENDAVAGLFEKNKLYDNLLKRQSINYKDRISAKLLPDEAILVYHHNTLFIIEKKFQDRPGSTDEKMQTCDFKRKQYKKLLKGTKIRVEYCYVFNDWFKQERYSDALDYIESIGCDYFFNTVPFWYLGLPTPKE